MNCYENHRRRCVVLNMILSFIAVLVLIAALLMQPIFAYAYDKGYLDYSSWDENSVNSEAIESEGAMGDLSGSLSYFTKESSAYFLFNLDESGINEDSAVSLIFSVTTPQIEYGFTVESTRDDARIDYSDEASKKAFSIESSAEPYSTGHAIIAVIMDISDKVYLHNFSIRIAVDGRMYSILDSEPLAIETAPVTSARSATTKSAKQSTANSKSSKKSGDYSKSSGTKRATSKSNKSSKTSKSTQNKAEQNDNSTHYTEDEPTNDEYDYKTAEQNYLNGSHFSKKAKAIMIGGGFLIGVGAVMLCGVEIASFIEHKIAEKSADDKAKEDNKIIDDE